MRDRERMRERERRRETTAGERHKAKGWRKEQKPNNLLLSIIFISRWQKIKLRLKRTAYFWPHFLLLFLYLFDSIDPISLSFS